MKKSTETLLSLLLLLVVVLSVINIIVISGRFGKVREAQALATELMRPADLQVMMLVNPACRECTSVTSLLDTLKGMNVNVTTERTVLFDSPEGQELMTTYKVGMLPTLIISGEINKTEQLSSFFASNGKIQNDQSVVYTAIPPPFYDPALQRVVGAVTLLYVKDSSCKECRPLDSLEQVLKQAGVGVTQVSSFDYSSPEGRELISRYGIQQVPAVVISEDIDAYPAIVQQLQRSGAVLKGDAYALHSTLAPYRDLKKNEIVGRVTLIMLKDENCSECYDVALNRGILSRFGLVITNQETYDAATGSAKALIEKYKITKIPAIVVSPDAQHYLSFVSVWEGVGSVESDGWYVMRRPEMLGTYRDLTTNTIVNPQAQRAAGTQENEEAEPSV